MVHKYVPGTRPLPARKKRLVPRILLHGSLDDIQSGITGSDTVILVVCKHGIDPERKPFLRLSGNIGLETVLVHIIVHCRTFLMFVCTGHIIVYIIRTARNGHGEIMRPGSPQHGSEPVICRFAGHWVDVPLHILAVLSVIIVDTFIEHLDEKVSGSKFKPVCPRLVSHAYACIH